MPSPTNLVTWHHLSTEDVTTPWIVVSMSLQHQRSEGNPRTKPNAFNQQDRGTRECRIANTDQFARCRVCPVGFFKTASRCLALSHPTRHHSTQKPRSVNARRATHRREGADSMLYGRNLRTPRSSTWIRIRDVDSAMAVIRTSADSIPRFLLALLTMLPLFHWSRLQRAFSSNSLQCY